MRRKEIPKIIRAECIQLVDSTGNIRAVFSAEDDKEGSVFLAICDRKEIRLSLGISPEGPDITVYDNKGNEIVNLLDEKILSRLLRKKRRRKQIAESDKQPRITNDG